MIKNGDAPNLSVILITPDSYETIRRTIHNIKLQKIKSRIEIIIVATSRDILQPDLSELQEFGSYDIVETGRIRSIGSAYAAGVRRASGPVVVLGEDHSFPQPGWAEGLIEAHQQPYAAVGPAISNANPNSLVSWADLLMAYSPWVEPDAAGTVDHLPGHNSSYKRSVLLDYGSDLEKMMETESVLHWDLRARGHQLFLQPSARTLHTNFALVSSLVLAHFHSGRQFGASRAENQKWGLGRKIIYCAASPLIPPLRLSRIVRDIQRLKKSSTFLLAVLPALILGLIMDAIGESLGYLFGAANSTQKLVPLEFHRNEHQKKNYRIT